jgi:hypothetical protein
MPILGVIASSTRQGQGPTDTGAMFPIAMASVDNAGASFVEFTNIPNTYTHLQLRGTYTCSTGPGTIRARVGNGSVDTGNNYAGHEISGTGSTTTIFTGGPSGNLDYLLLESQQAYQWSFVSDYIDYSKTNKYKTIRNIIGGDNNGSGYIGMRSTLWLSNSAITNIRFFTQSGNFVNSTFALYGIK